MKRENFKIVWKDQEATKHSWNSSRREVIRLIQNIANEEKTTYTLLDEENKKTDFSHTSGFQKWQGDNGNIVVFVIRKV
jgi:hypothetical protein